jgi:hypothetical protein
VSAKFGQDGATNGPDLTGFTEPNGVVSSSNWNLLRADVAGSGFSAFVDSNGDALTGTNLLTLTSDTAVGGANANFAPHVGGMYYGHIGTGSSDVNLTINFADFDNSGFGAGFDLYVYTAHGNANNLTEGLSVTAAGATKFVKGNQRLYETAGGFLEGTGTSFAATEQESNYVVFSGLGSGDLSGGNLLVTIKASNVNRTAVNGIQLVAVPEPSSFALLGGFLALSFATILRRR